MTDVEDKFDQGVVEEHDEDENEFSPNPRDIPPLPEEDKYVVFMETNDEECETWYFFLKWQGNEDNLRHLQKQIESVDWELEEDMSTFDIDLEHPVSSLTAKEMTKIEVNRASFHRKFDGELERIDLKLRNSDSTHRKIKKVCKVLAGGQIEDYITLEDIDPSDLTDNSDESSSSSSESSSDDDDEKDEREEKKGDDNKGRRKKGLPPSLLEKVRQRASSGSGGKTSSSSGGGGGRVEVPRYARAKRAKNRRK